MSAHSITDVMKMLPHRYPMLLVDKILELEPGKRVRGLKNVTINEQFFEGHYPGMPLMPGVLIVETIAQVGAIILLSCNDFEGHVPVIGAIEQVKFKRMVSPGDQLILDVEMLWFKAMVGKIHGEARVDGEVVATMDLIFKIVPTEAK